MLSASADLVAAALATQRTPLVDLRVDWQNAGYSTAAAGAGPAQIRDSFDRAVVASGWGVADGGMPWTTTGGSASDYSVDGTVGKHSVGSLATARYSLIDAPADVDVSFTVSTPVTALTVDFRTGVLARYADASNHYVASVVFGPAAAKDVSVNITKVVAGATTSLSTVDTTLTHVAATVYGVRFQCVGSVLRARAWVLADGEPTTWHVSVTDAALTGAGASGVKSVVAATSTNTLPVVFSFNDFRMVNVASVQDLSSAYESVTLERWLSADTPDEVRLVEGSAAAQLTVQLAKGEVADEKRTAAWRYSPYNASSPLAGADRHNVPIKAAFGFQTAAGPETVRRFTGRTVNLPVRPKSASAELTALDGRDRMRTTVDLPMILANQNAFLKPGLNASWVVDYALRANGIYTSPAIRSQCVFSATMHGSAWPEVGRLNDQDTTHWFDNDSADFFPCRFEQGRYSPVLLGGDGGSFNRINAMIDQSHYQVGANDGQTVFFEFWAYLTPGADAPALMFMFGESYPAFFMDWVDVGTDSKLVFTINRNATDPGSSIDGPTVSGVAAWRYIGVHMTFGTTITIRCRVDSTTTTVVDADPSMVDGVNFKYVSIIGTTVPVEAYQVTAEPYSATMWNNAFTPSAILSMSANELTAIPPGISSDPWDLVSEVANAEFATHGFDENDLYLYQTRDRWISTEAQTQQRVLSTVDSIANLDIDDGLMAVRNVISVPASPVTVSALADVWSASEMYTIPPRNSLVVWANFNDTTLNVPPYFTSGLSLDSNWFMANSRPDGTGIVWSTGIQVYFEAVFANSAKIRLVNSNPGPLYMIDTTGAPALHVLGQAVSQDENASTTPIATSASSIAKYGTRPLPVSANRWRQSQSVAKGIAGDLLGELAVPRPTVKNIEIKADPRLRVGNRVGLADPDGVGPTSDFWIIGITDKVDRQGYRQMITVRQATTVLLWDVGRWDVNVWGS